MSRRKVDTRRHSSLVFDGLKQTPSRAMLRAVGFRRFEVVAKPGFWLGRWLRALQSGASPWRESQRGRVTVHAWK